MSTRARIKVYQAAYQRLKLSHRRTIVAKVRSGTAYYQPLLLLSPFSARIERPDPVGPCYIRGSPFQIPQNCVPLIEQLESAGKNRRPVVVDYSSNILRTIGHHSIRKSLLSSCVSSNIVWHKRVDFYLKFNICLDCAVSRKKRRLLFYVKFFNIQMKLNLRSFKTWNFQILEFMKCRIF